MRGIFGIVGLLVTLAIVGVVVKKQLHTTVAVPVVPGATVQQQSQQVQQQYKQSVESAMQPVARPDSDTK